METGISIVDHDRVTAYHAERSWFGYLYATVGVSLFLTMAMVLVIVWSSMAPAVADEARVIKGPGKGYYDSGSLTGAAAADIRAYMDATWVECQDLKGFGRCDLNASTETVQVLYAGEYAAALIVYDVDTGNHPSNRLGLWKRQNEGQYAMLATSDELGLISDAHMANDNGALRLSGTIQGPNDAFCCPSLKARYDLALADGKLSVTRVNEPVRRKPNPALAALSGFSSLPELSFPKPRPKSPISGFDFSHSNYAGEAPMVFFHNDSEMMLFPRHGIIAYKEPKVSLTGVVKETDILFEGTMTKTGIVGTAYLFKKGCAPMPYRVSGPGYKVNRQGVPSSIVLTGVAPIRATNSCEVVGTRVNGQNSVLRFEPAGFYAEDAMEAETHSGEGYEVVDK